MKTMIIDEIAELAKIPEIEDYFAGVLLEVKKKFRDKINEYRLKENIKNESPTDKLEQLEEEEISELSEAFKKNKTYFFELIRVEDPGREPAFRWEVEKFNLKTRANGKIKKIIFDDFIRNVDRYEVTSSRIQDKIVDIPFLDKKIQINFTKSSPTRVVGFVKEYKEKAEEKFVLKRNRNMLKLNTTVRKHQEMGKEELQELLQTNPEFMDSMLFSIRMKQEASL